MSISSSKIHKRKYRNTMLMKLIYLLEYFYTREIRRIDTLFHMCFILPIRFTWKYEIPHVNNSFAYKQINEILKEWNISLINSNSIFNNDNSLSVIFLCFILPIILKSWIRYISLITDWKIIYGVFMNIFCAPNCCEYNRKWMSKLKNENSLMTTHVTVIICRY